MDTFTDKQAQRLNAQELIQANAAAEAAELSRMREQNSAYEAMLANMKENVDRNAQSADKIAQSAEAFTRSAELTAQGAERSIQNAGEVSKNLQKTEGLIAAALSKIQEMQTNSQNTEELQNLLEEIKKTQAGQSTEITDFVHKESVKVYRNVQAVLTDEMTKQNEGSGKTITAIKGKVGAVMGISILALLVSAAGLAFQILVYLNII